MASAFSIPDLLCRPGILHRSASRWLESELERIMPQHAYPNHQPGERDVGLG
jgi:hypothetical protein